MMYHPSFINVTTECRYSPRECVLTTDEIGVKTSSQAARRTDPFSFSFVVYSAAFCYARALAHLS
jgi:hypothetical protein